MRSRVVRRSLARTVSRQSAQNEASKASRARRGRRRWPIALKQPAGLQDVINPEGSVASFEKGANEGVGLGHRGNLKQSCDEPNVRRVDPAPPTSLAVCESPAFQRSVTGNLVFRSSERRRPGLLSQPPLTSPCGKLPPEEGWLEEGAWRGLHPDPGGEQ